MFDLKNSYEFYSKVFLVGSFFSDVKKEKDCYLKLQEGVLSGVPPIRIQTLKVIKPENTTFYIYHPNYTYGKPINLIQAGDYVMKAAEQLGITLLRHRVEELIISVLNTYKKELELPDNLQDGYGVNFQDKHLVIENNGDGKILDPMPDMYFRVACRAYFANNFDDFFMTKTGKGSDYLKFGVPGQVLRNELFAGFLERVNGDHKLLEYLQIWLGISLTASYRKARGFFSCLIGPKKTGKSSIATIIEKSLGDNTVCYIPINSIANSRNLAPLEHSLLNICDDVGKFKEGAIQDAWEPIKKATQTFSRIEVDPKFIQPFYIVSMARMLFISNDFIPFLMRKQGADESFWDRLLLIPILGEVKSLGDQERDDLFFEKLVDKNFYFYYKFALDGLYKFVLYGGLRRHKPPIVKEWEYNYRSFMLTRNVTVEQFEQFFSSQEFFDLFKKVKIIHSGFVTKTEVYFCYTAWCKSKQIAVGPRDEIFKSLPFCNAVEFAFVKNKNYYYKLK